MCCVLMKITLLFKLLTIVCLHIIEDYPVVLNATCDVNCYCVVQCVCIGVNEESNWSVFQSARHNEFKPLSNYLKPFDKCEWNVECM